MVRQCAEGASSRPVFEPVEPRLLLAVTPVGTGGAGPGTVPLVADAEGPAPTLTNPADGAGDVDPDILNGRGWLEVTFADASAIKGTTVTDAAPEFTLGGAGAANVKLGAPKLVSGQTYRYAFTGAFVPGPVTVNFLAGTVADVAGNLNDAASASFTIFTPQGQRFGATGGHKGVVLKLTDADQTLVTFSMTGPGFGEILDFAGRWSLFVTGTTTASSVTITTAKSAAPGDDGEVDLAAIALNNPVGNVTGKTTNLTGPVGVAGSLGTLTLDDVDLASVTFNGAAAVATGALVFDQVARLSVSSPQMPLKSITATEWLDPAAGSVISAPWLGTLTIKGRAANVLKQITPLAGDLDASLDLAGKDAQGKSIGTLWVAGKIASASMTLAGAAGSITAAEWTGTLVQAKSLGTVTVKGGMTGVSATLSQLPSTTVKALGTLTVAGAMDGCTITSAGNIGTVTVGALTSSMLAAGNLTGAAGTQATLGTLNVKGLAALANDVAASSVSAWQLGTITLRDVQTANGGTAFGVEGHKIASYTRYVGKTVVRKALNQKGPQATPLDADTDFSVRLI